MKGRKDSIQRRPKKGKPKLRLIPAPNSREAPDFGPNEQEYFSALHKILDQIFDEASKSYNWTWSQLAAHANLGYQTVSNLGERVTIYPRYLTVHKLAKAIGWQLAVNPDVKKKHASTAKIAVG